MHDTEVFFTTADVVEVSQRLQKVTDDYEELFNKLCKQIFTSIEKLDSPSDQVAVTVQYVQDSIQVFSSNFPDKYSAACGKGCAQCCNFPVDTPPQAIEDIAVYLEESMSNTELDDLKIKMAEYVAAQQPPLYRAQCPFLDDQQACSIYVKRPLACRWFLSPDVKLCEESVQNGQTITQHPIHSRIYEAASTALLAADRKNSGNGQQVKFIPSLLERLNN